MTGFGNKTVLQLLTYLHTTFGSISEKELELNTARMQLQWNSPTAIEALFLQLKNGVSFATAGQDAPTKPKILTWAYNNINQTGRFDIACCEWRQMDPSAKDWPVFKRHFKAADKDLRRMDTTGTAGFHCSAHSVLNTTDTEGFHGSAHSAHTTITLVTTTQAALVVSELALARALAQVSLSSSSTAASATNISAITPTSSGTRRRGYCWTRGRNTNSSHTSATCNRRDDVYQVTATSAHSMGGQHKQWYPSISTTRPMIRRDGYIYGSG
jgi:hypothetical protein